MCARAGSEEDEKAPADDPEEALADENSPHEKSLDENAPDEKSPTDETTEREENKAQLEASMASACLHGNEARGAKCRESKMKCEGGAR